MAHIRWRTYVIPVKFHRSNWFRIRKIVELESGDSCFKSTRIKNRELRERSLQVTLVRYIIIIVLELRFPNKNLADTRMMMGGGRKQKRLSSIGWNYRPFRNKSRYIAAFLIFICELYIEFYVKHKHFEFIGFSLIGNLKKEVYTVFKCCPRRFNRFLFNLFLFYFDYKEIFDNQGTMQSKESAFSLVEDKTCFNRSTTSMSMRESWIFACFFWESRFRSTVTKNNLGFKVIKIKTTSGKIFKLVCVKNLADCSEWA